MGPTERKSKASSALKANSTSRAVPNAVPIRFEARAGERSRVSTFVWRPPRIAAYYASLRDCTLPGERDVHREAQRQGANRWARPWPEMRYRRRTRPILRHKCVSLCNFDSHELGDRRPQFGRQLTKDCGWPEPSRRLDRPADPRYVKLVD